MWQILIVCVGRQLYLSIFLFSFVFILYISNQDRSLVIYILCVILYDDGCGARHLEFVEIYV